MQKSFCALPCFFCLPGSPCPPPCLRAVPYRPQPASQPLCFSARHPPTLCFAAPGKPCLVLKTRRNIFPPLPSPLPQGERKNIYSLSRFTQIPGAYRSEHKRGRKSVSLIFSERARQRAEISPRSARQCAKRLSHQILRAVWQGGYSHHVIGFLKSFARKREDIALQSTESRGRFLKKESFCRIAGVQGEKRRGEVTSSPLHLCGSLCTCKAGTRSGCCGSYSSRRTCRPCSSSWICCSPPVFP